MLGLSGALHYYRAELSDSINSDMAHHLPSDMNPESIHSWDQALSRSEHALRSGMNKLALEYAEQAKELGEKTFVEPDGRWLRVNEILITVYTKAGYLAKAYQRAELSVSICKQLTPGKTDELADHLRTLGALSLELEDFSGATAAFEEVVELFRHGNETNPTALMTSLLTLATAYLEDFQDQKAAEAISEAFFVLRETPSSDALRVVESLMTTSEKFYRIGQCQSAELLLNTALESMTRFRTAQGHDVPAELFDSLEAETLLLKARVQILNGRFESAVETTNRLISTLDHLHPEQRFEVKKGIASVLRSQGDAESAEELMREEIAQRQREFGSTSDPRIATRLLELAKLQLNRYRAADARDMCNKIIHLVEPSEPPPEALLLRGTASLILGEREEALSSLKKGYESLLSDGATDRSRIHQASLLYAQGLIRSGALKEAEGLVDAATDHFYPSSRLRNNSQFSSCLQLKAEIETARENYADAESLLLQAKDSFALLLGTADSALMLGIYRSLANLYQLRGQYKKSMLTVEKALSLLDTLYAPEEATQISLYQLQARNCDFFGQREKAELFRSRAHTLLQRLDSLNDFLILSNYGDGNS